MCEPTTIMMVVGAVAGGGSSVASSSAANAQAEAQMDSAVASNTQQQAALQLQQVQTNQAASQEAQDRAAQTNRELAKFMVAAGASGLGGVSIERQDASIVVGENLDLGVLDTNRENRIAQSQLKALGVQAQAQGRVNQAEASGVGPLQQALGIIQGASSGAAAGGALAGAAGLGASGASKIVGDPKAFEALGGF